MLMQQYGNTLAVRRYLIASSSFPACFVFIAAVLYWSRLSTSIPCGPAHNHAAINLPIIIKTVFRQISPQTHCIDIG